MKKPLVLIAAIVAVVGFGAVAAVAKDTNKVRTSVTLRFHSDLSGPKPDWLDGDLKARKRACEKGRKVTVYAGGHVIGSDKSNDFGQYEVIPLG